MRPEDLNKYWLNEVKVTGKLHRINGADLGSHSGKTYVKFSIRTETMDFTEGSFRPNYVICRAYNRGTKDFLERIEEGEILTVTGEIVASRGSGGLFVLVKDLETEKPAIKKV